MQKSDCIKDIIQCPASILTKALKLIHMVSFVSHRIKPIVEQYMAIIAVKCNVQNAAHEEELTKTFSDRAVLGLNTSIYIAGISVSTAETSVRTNYYR